MKLEKTFYSDSMRNFMILKGPEGQAKSGYQYRILSANTIERMLPCSVRFIDDTCLLYYDVTSMQAISVLFECRRIGFAALRELLTGLLIAQEKLAGYLLDARRMIYDPECIFYDFERKQYLFAYYPEDLEGNDCGNFYSFIAEHIDTYDEKAVTAAYELTDVAMAQDGFLLTEKYLHRLTGGESGTAGEDGPRSREEKWEAALGEGRSEDASAFREQKGGQQAELSGGRDTSRNTALRSDPADGRKENGDPGMIRIAAAGAFAAGMVMFVLRYVLKTAGKTDSMFRTVIVTSMTVSVLLYLYSLAGSFLAAMHAEIQHAGFGELERNHSRRRLRAGSRRRDRAVQEAAEQEEERERRHARLAELETEFGVRRESEMEYSPDHFPEYAADRPVERTVEETGRKVLRLYGIGEARKHHIHLDELPCTVGSMREFSDIAIDDSTVSRLHVRFFEKDGEVHMTDLNSLYGTCLNGERLEPNETAKLLPHDEIRIGRLEFRCR